jgi:hypothetical protein
MVIRTTPMTFAVSFLQLQLRAMPWAVARALALASGREPSDDGNATGIVFLNVCDGQQGF